MEPAAPNHNPFASAVRGAVKHDSGRRRTQILDHARSAGGKAPGDSSGHGISSSAFNVSFVHPLEFRPGIRSATEPHPRQGHRQPAARTTLFFVHDAVPLHGKTHVVHQKCMVLLHVPNFHGARRKPLENMKLQPFQNWVFGTRV
ncbi:hypothetical protein Vretimale_16900 [Volvox reticuliferus]|uniref:Uncharacterized protein n=1 Tax=Volvox reticuliferus TaxID=1737510 RepID=A0A8J4LWP9_9CHLO|nr:hypothetical protein Vretimale_16900 [Volvox reticuliferus]